MCHWRRSTGVALFGFGRGDIPKRASLLDSRRNSSITGRFSAPIDRSGNWMNIGMIEGIELRSAFSQARFVADRVSPVNGLR